MAKCISQVRNVTIEKRWGNTWILICFPFWPQKRIRKMQASGFPYGYTAATTAEVMRRLAIHWLSNGARAALGLEEALLSKLAYFLGAVHDIGKATVLFQSNITQRLPEVRERLARQCAFPKCFVFPRATPHAKASEAILLQLGLPKGRRLHRRGPPRKAPGERAKRVYRREYRVV